MKTLATITILPGLFVGGGQLAGLPMASAQSWPEFRGPGGQGQSEATNLPLDWTDAIRWKTSIPGRGWSSPVVVVIFHMDGTNSQFVVGLDLSSGSSLWKTRRSGELNPSPSMQKAFATPTIFADGYVWFANRDGEVIIVRPGEEYDEAARHQLDSQIMGTPAAVGSALFVRTAGFLYRIEKSSMP